MPSFGTLTPSSNTVVEQVTFAMLRDLDNVSSHFARFDYAGASAQFADDYDWAGMLEAARLLAHARVDAICWNGSRGGTLGLERDKLLCERVEADLRTPATTSTLALDQLLKGAKIRRPGFVTPYVDRLTTRLTEVWEQAGFDVAAALGLGLTDNFSYSTVPSETLRGMAQEAKAEGAEAVVFYCTNMRAAELCAPLEAELGIPVLDAVSAGVWGTLNLIGQPTGLTARWGSLLV